VAAYQSAAAAQPLAPSPVEVAALDRHAAPDVVAPPPRHPRFRHLDGMRAIAVLTVVGVHAAAVSAAVSGSLSGRLLARLNIGVTIFFLISGFLLFRPMIAYRGGGASAPAVGDYAKRRFLRIYPAYWLVLTVLVILPGVPRVTFGPLWTMYGLVHTLVMVHGQTCVDAVSPPCGLAQTWSLVVELTFYAVLPVYVLVVERLTRRLALRGWALAQLSTLAGLSALSVIPQLLTSSVPTWMGASVAAYVFWFALGMGMAVVSVYQEGTPKRPRAGRSAVWSSGAAWVLAIGAYVALALWLPATTFLIDRTQVMTAHVAYGLIAALLMIPAVFETDRGGLPRRVLAHPLLAWIGVISYGIFLWHVAVVQKLGSEGAASSFIVTFAATLAISIACAAASYYVLERPILRLKYRRLRDLGAHMRSRLTTE
jgi:peptidoglycan/LPS O-acetylase OafA/YrhL